MTDAFSLFSLALECELSQRLLVLLFILFFLPSMDHGTVAVFDLHEVTL